MAYSLLPGKRLAMIGGDPYPIADEVGFGTAWGEHTFDQRVRNVPQIIGAAAEAPSLAAAFHFVPHHLRTRPARSMRPGGNPPQCSSSMGLASRRPPGWEEATRPD